MSFAGKEKPKQIFEISSSHQNGGQSSSQSLSFAGKPKQEFQISSSHQKGGNSTQGFSFKAPDRPKQVYQISSQTSIQPSTQSLSFAGKEKPKQIFEISSNHQGNNNSSGSQGLSFIAPEKPKYIPVSNGISLGGKPYDYKISSSNQTSNSGNGISYIAPERKKQIYSMTSGISYDSKSNNKNSTISQSSQGISYIAPDPPKKNKIEYTDSKGISIQFVGSSIPPKGKGKSKHYSMQYNNKYKKSDPKNYKVVSKVVNLYFKGNVLRGARALDYIIQQISQPQRNPNMSVKAFFSKKGRRKGGRK